jgi:2-polyprenyl-3-methyl-5-hydroxy-6-metoxy-1,4-benzoquinol methylase
VKNIAPQESWVDREKGGDRSISSIPSIEAGPEFYSMAYYLEQCGGHELFEEFDGWQLEPIRHKAVELANPEPGQLALDVGCGRGEIVLACALRGARAIGIDFSSDAVRLAQSLLSKFQVSASALVIRMDAANLGFSSNQFDTIFMLDFVEHISQDRLKGILNQCHRMLKPGGKLIVHTGPTLEFIRYGQHIKRLLYTVRRQPVPALITLASEAELAGHCNLHCRESLLDALAVFESKWVEYQFSIDRGPLKRMAHALGLTRVLAFNLWGVGVKEALGHHLVAECGLRNAD